MLRFAARTLALCMLLVTLDLVLSPRSQLRFAYSPGRVLAYAADGSVTDYRLAEDGRPISIAVARVGALTGIRYPAGWPTRISYDAAGRLVSAVDGSGSTSVGYDVAGLPVQRQHAAGLSLSAERSPWGYVRELRVGENAARTEYRHDILGNLTFARSAVGEVSFTTDPSARAVTRSWATGLRSEYVSDSQGRLRRLTHSDPGGRAIAVFEQEFDGHGRRTRSSETVSGRASTESYTYDVLGRLDTVTRNGREWLRYSYDAMGNRIEHRRDGVSTDATFDVVNRLLRAGDAAFEHDARGNVVARTAAGKTTHYRFDLRNRLVEVATPSARVRYVYNALDQLVAREHNGASTSFLQDDLSGALSQVIAERSNGQVSREYLLAGGRLGHRDHDDTLLYLEDGQGSTRLVVDSAGTVRSQYAYEPFGTAMLVDGEHTADFLYAGEYVDPITGLIFLRARWYDPSLGRFLSLDPVRGTLLNPQSFNRYVYALNDPNLRDPSGLQPEQAQAPPQRQASRPASTSKPLSALPEFLLRGPFSAIHPEPQVRTMQHVARALLFGTSSQIRLLGVAMTTNDIVSNLTARNYSGAANGVANLGVSQVKSFMTPRVRDMVSLGQAFNTEGKIARELIAAGILNEHTAQTYLGFRGFASSIGPNSVLQSVRAGVNVSTSALAAASDWWQSRRTSSSDISAAQLAGNRTVPGFLPPPPGGGGMSMIMPPVGGVQFHQTLQLLESLGQLRGVVHDVKSGRLVLIGDQSRALPTAPEDFAAAIKAVYARDAVAPGMSIDPKPGDPLAAMMDVVYFATARSRIGLQMYSADLAMKNLSLGIDSITKQKMTSAVRGYRSILDGESSAHDPALWNRFWIVSDDVAAQSSTDGRALLLSRPRIRIKTETMRWSGSKLVPAGGVNPDAERFASHLTDHYDEFAVEHPAFADVRNAASAIAIARYLKTQSVPVDWNLVDAMARPVDTPSETPSARFERQQVATTGSGTMVRTTSVFGGVEMKPELIVHPGRTGDQLQAAVENTLVRAEPTVPVAFAIRVASESLRAVALPLGTAKPLSDVTIGTELTVGDAALRELPGLLRVHVDNGPIQAGGFGLNWYQPLPRLKLEPRGDIGSVGYIQFDRGPKIRHETIQMIDDLGWTSERFSEPFEDDHGMTAFRPESPQSRYVAAYSFGDGYTVVGKDGAVASFDTGGRLWRFVRDPWTAQYHYDGDRLASIDLSSPQIKTSIAFSYGSRANILGVNAGGEAISYETDEAGNLIGVTNRGVRTRYSYAAGRAVAIRDGVAQSAGSQQPDEIPGFAAAGLKATPHGAALLLGDQDKAPSYVLTTTGTETLLASIDGEPLVTMAVRDGRISELKYPDGSLERRSYDALGRLTTMVRRFRDEPVDTLDFSYDAGGDVVMRHASRGPIALNAAPEAASERRNMESPQFQIDANSSTLTGVHDSAGGVTTYTYDDQVFTADLPNGGRVVLYLDDSGRLLGEDVPARQHEGRFDWLTRYLRAWR